jgi:phosphoadenosine phosphosulfate reductase
MNTDSIRTKDDKWNHLSSFRSSGAEGFQDPEGILRDALGLFHPGIALACSFSLEDIVLIDMATQQVSDFRVFALDTGRLPEETHECAELVRERYGLRIEWFFPASQAVEALVAEKGSFSFRTSVEARRECCRIRKVDPLKRALSGLDAWITGMRREHAITRHALPLIERDEAHGGIAKFNPLAGWTTAQVEDYARRRALPRNRLYAQGYTSIGCAPCTRAVAPGEDIRAGRWWWEHPEHKECGLHVKGN